jgi:CheY-like chemotaxis protein
MSLPTVCASNSRMTPRTAWTCSTARWTSCGPAASARADAAVSLQREASKLRGIGTVYGYPLVGLIAQRLETYLAKLPRFDEREQRDLMIFADRIAVAVEREEKPDVGVTNQIIRALPVRYEFDITDVEIHDVEILLVTPSKVVARLVGTEMAACGYRTQTVHDPIESFAIAVRTPPDMVIASAVMDGLTGIDLIRALKAIPHTGKVPMAVLTSLDSVPAVPHDVAIIRVGSHFGEDFAAAITRFNLG